MLTVLSLFRTSKTRFLLAVSISVFALQTLSGAPVQAAIQRSADFSEGQTLGIGLYGIAYDYSAWNVSVGAYAVSKQYGSNLTPIFDQSPDLGLRFAARSYEQDGLSVGWIGGIHVSSQNTYNNTINGYQQRGLLTPDLGMSVAYGFNLWELPLAFRLNLTLGFSLLERGDVLQRLQFGPQTGLEVAWQPRKDLEVTLGGGTLMGMRLKF
jgi:hypothetical protein